MFIKVFDEAIVGEVNPNANVIPVANISFDKEDIQKMIQDELKKFRVENNIIWSSQESGISCWFSENKYIQKQRNED